MDNKKYLEKEYLEQKKKILDGALDFVHEIFSNVIDPRSTNYVLVDLKSMFNLYRNPVGSLSENEEKYIDIVINECADSPIIVPINNKKINCIDFYFCEDAPTIENYVQICSGLVVKTVIAEAIQDEFRRKYNPSQPTYYGTLYFKY